MGSDMDSFIVFFKRRIEPFIAVGIFIMLIIVAIGLYNEKQITEDIKENCGWGEEDYYCFCEKGRVNELEDAHLTYGSQGLNLSGMEIDNAQVDSGHS